ncbi:MAG: hypothetical protein WCH65_04995 [bacterium]
MIHNFATVASKIDWTSCIFSNTFGQVIAVILLTHEATASCETTEKHPISLVLDTCVHPQSSKESKSESCLI